MNSLNYVISLSFIFVVSHCNVYLHSPRGSNNRLNENTAVRRNGNRLFDSQNNARGGYNVGDSSSSPFQREQQQYRMNYFQSGSDPSGNSELTIEWTAQHGCGENGNNSPNKLNCNLVLQFMCQDDVSNASPDDTYSFRNGKNTDKQPYIKPATRNSDTTTRSRNAVRSDRGLHESWEWYDACYRRDRNKGLFTADQNLDKNNQGTSSAIFTRQSPSETQFGFECPEERDYYPYFHPSPWVDIAVLTSNQSSCKYYKENSFSHRTYGYCVDTSSTEVRKYWSSINNPSACREKEGALWVEYHSFLELAPQYTNRRQCLRQNNGGRRVKYMWGKPYDMKKIANDEDIEDTCFVVPPPLDCKTAEWTRVNNLGDGRNVHPINYTWILPHFPSGNKKRCVFRLRYNITTDDYDPVQTDARQNQKKVNNVITQRSPIEQNPLVDIGANGQLLQLAINTVQTGRTFQDRSHVFFLSPRPSEISSTARLLNLNVRGKRGNIVQTFPAVEYDFVPNRLHVSEDDLIHIQWTGSNRHNNRNPSGDGAAGDAGEGTGGTDRTNMVEIQHPGDNLPTPYENSTLYQSMDLVWSALGIHGATDEEKQRNTAIQMASSGYFRCENRRDCGRESLEAKKALQNQLNNAPASFPGFVTKFKKGSYHYMCSRNNNFSNRSQKGMIFVR